MDPSPRPWELDERADVDELALLRTRPSVTHWSLASLEPISALASATREGDPPSCVLVRGRGASASGPSCLVLVDPAASPSVELEAASSCAAALFGLTAARFQATVPDAARSGASAGADLALTKLARAHGHELPAPSWERLCFVVEQLRARTPDQALLLHALGAGRAFASVTTRDPRTGAGPARVICSSSPTAALEGRAVPAANAAPAPSEALRAELAELATALELDLGRPLRALYELSGDAARLVAVSPLRRSGLATFGLVHDWVRAGFPAERALRLIGRDDVLAAVPLRVDAVAPQASIVGIAAGPGIAEGFVATSPDEALALARAGLPAILFVHDIEPEDLAALRASAGLVTVRGGLTGEAAVAARGLGKPCVASGAGLSLASDHVRFAEYGELRAGERVSIDGSTGLIARGAHGRARLEPPPAVAFVLSLLSAAAPELVAAVDHPAHVRTALELGARRLVLARPNAVLMDAAALAGAPVDAVLAALFDAMSGQVERAYVLPPSPGTELPRPLMTRIDDADARAFVDSALRAAERAGVRVVLGDEARAAAAAACPADAVLAARMCAARA